VEAIHEAKERHSQCPKCQEDTLIRLIGHSSKLKKQKQEAKQAKIQQEKKESRRSKGFAYYCRYKKCGNDEETIDYHKSDENPRVPCPKCNKKMKRGISRKAANARVSFEGWWPDKRRKEVKARFKQQESKAKARDIDINKLRGWAKRKSKKTVSPYLSDPAVDGKQKKHDKDPSTGHFHHELEM
jgi:predicted nucleic acid-binding Zn ribbon protein